MDNESIVTVLDNEFATVWYHPKEKITHHQFKQFIYGEPLREVLLLHLDILERNGAFKILSDDRGNGPMTPEDMEWAATNCMPRVRKLGLKYWAVVMPALVLGQMNMRRWIKTYANLGVTAKAFTDPDEALTWLVAQP